MRAEARCQLSIGVGMSALSTEIRQSYRQAVSALEYRVIAGDNRVIHYEDIVRVAIPAEDGCRQATERLLFYLSAGLAAQVEESLDEIMTFGTADGADVLLEARQRAIDIVVGSRRLLESESIGASDGEGDWAFLFAGTLPEIRKGLHGYLHRLANRVWSNTRDKTGDLVEKVKVYLHEHMAEDGLRLADAAAALYISPGHLGRIMKQELGKTFVEYLTQLRIQKAAELLATTGLRSYEIAGLVGVADAHYFSILFKKTMGFSVQEYRERLLGQNRPSDEDV